MEYVSTADEKSKINVKRRQQKCTYFLDQGDGINKG